MTLKQRVVLARYDAAKFAAGWLCIVAGMSVFYLLPACFGGDYRNFIETNRRGYAWVIAAVIATPVFVYYFGINFWALYRYRGVAAFIEHETLRVPGYGIRRPVSQLRGIAVKSGLLIVMWRGGKSQDLGVGTWAGSVQEIHDRWKANLAVTLGVHGAEETKAPKADLPNVR